METLFVLAAWEVLYHIGTCAGSLESAYIVERDLIRASSVGIRLTHKLDVTLENGFFEMSSYSRANVRLIYEKTKGQSLDLHWENKYTS